MFKYYESFLVQPYWLIKQGFPFCCLFCEDHFIIEFVQIYLKPFSIFDIPQRNFVYIWQTRHCSSSSSQQQDTSQTLSVILTWLCGESLNIFSILKTVPCVCKCPEKRNLRQYCNILFQIQSNLPYIISLKSEYMTEENKFLCNFCPQLQPALLDSEFASADHFVTQLKRLLNVSGFVTKDA